MSKIKFLVGLILSSLIIFCLVFLLSNQKKQSVETAPKYIGAVLPHDILAVNLVDDFLSRLNYLPEKIYIIGPNHFEVGNSVVITNNNPETNSLLNFNFIKSNDEVITKEHSITVLENIFLPKYPQSQIIPLIISANISLSNMENLIDYLSKNISDTTLLLCSVDFSHYRSLSEADIFDQQSIEFIKEKDYSKIYTLNNDYVDSPKSLIIFLKTLDKIGKNKLTILNHSNSAIINQDLNATSTTSHFELAFE
jgi:AmmeMemoRadiSam system protein B